MIWLLKPFFEILISSGYLSMFNLMIVVHGSICSTLEYASDHKNHDAWVINSRMHWWNYDPLPPLGAFWHWDMLVFLFILIYVLCMFDFPSLLLWEYLSFWLMYMTKGYHSSLESLFDSHKSSNVVCNRV